MHDRGSSSIRSGIARLRARWWRVHLARFAIRGLFYGLFGGALVALLFPELGLGTILIGLGALVVTASLIAGVLRRPSDVGLAKALDDSAELADQVSSTVELASESGPMVEALREEARAAALATPVERVLPFQTPREGRWLPVSALVLAAAVWIPIATAPEARADVAFEASLEERLEELEDLLSIEREKELTPRMKELLLELEKLRAELDPERVDKKDTQAEVARLLDRLRKERDEEREKARELRKLLKSLQENTNKNALDPSLQQGDFQKALNKLREELEELRKQLDKKRKEGASPEELEALEEEIRKLEEMEAKLMQLLQLDLDLRFMGKAIDFLAHWDGELGDLEEFDPDGMLEPGEP